MGATVAIPGDAGYRTIDAAVSAPYLNPLTNPGNGWPGAIVLGLGGVRKEDLCHRRIISRVRTHDPLIKSQMLYEPADS